MPMVAKTLLGAIVGLAVAGPYVVAEELPESPKPGVLFTGTVLPAPPKQGQPWTPPASKLSKTWDSAVQAMLKHGIADPRGCQYREVELSCGSSAWGEFALVTTHAWLIPQGPAEKAGASRFAVTWDGLVYPVTRVGPAADVKADVEAMIAADDKWWIGAVAEGEKKTKENPKFAFAYRPHRWHHALSEGSLASYKSLLPLKSLMMHVLGQGELAQRLWEAWKRGSEIEQDRRSPADDPYLVFAREWGWALFDRAVGAHKCGDDVISMLDAKTLVELEQAVERVASGRGFPRPPDPRPNNREMPYLDFGEPPARLLEDQTRRVKDGRVQRVLDAGMEELPDQSKRIAALIRDLEVASAEQWGQPGGVSISESPVVQSLIKEGRPAVEPLLECLANDRRLTRAVGFHRNFFPSRYFISVGEAAFAALRGIFEVDHFGPLTEHGYQDEASADQRRVIAEEIRAYWEKSKGRTRQETWFRVLADDKATSNQWVEVAQKIVEPDRASQGGDRFRVEGAIRLNDPFHVAENDGDRDRPLAGESLRSKKDPSLTELFVKRSDEMARLAKPQELNFFAWDPVCDLMLCLAKWDRKSALPLIHRCLVDLRMPMQNQPLIGNQGLENLAERFALLAEAGVQAGDDAIVHDYVAWLRATAASDFSFFHLSIFMPLWRHSENPKMTELARWLFLAEDSPWHPIHDLKPLNSSRMINSPLVGVPAFRELLKREFTNTSPIGHFTVSREGLSLEAMHSMMSAASYYAPDVELPKSAEKQPLRACDFYALQISRLEGCPRYELYWPEKRRDAVLKDVAQFLDQWGNCFRDRSQSLDHLTYHFGSTPPFRLSRLLRPATPEDVAAGRAIFSLRDKPGAQVRVVPLKPYPSVARWKTLKQFLLREPGVMEWPKDENTADRKVWAGLPKEPFDREGLIWQAEEVQREGKWHRYYGFVGNHMIAKVPAEEIEILDRFSPAHPPRFQVHYNESAQ
jgi:hypothetical protein